MFGGNCKAIFSYFVALPRPHSLTPARPLIDACRKHAAAYKRLGLQGGGAGVVLVHRPLVRLFYNLAVDFLASFFDCFLFVAFDI